MTDQPTRTSGEPVDLLDALAQTLKIAREDLPRSRPAPYVEAIEPDEPDYDEEYEADQAADRYERWLDSQW